MQLENKVAIVTGASSGIGAATAKLFAKEGASVALIGRDAESLQTVATEIGNDKTKIIPADLAELSQCRGMIDKAIHEFGQLNILVNAAGIIATGSIADTSPEAWHQMMRINLDAVFCLMHYATPHLEQTNGSIVNVSSVTGVRSFPNVLAYCVSKAGVDQLTRCAALDLAPKGVRVNAINPGVVVTNLHRRGGMDEKKYARFLEHSKTTHPLGRVGQPEEIAEAILYLASDRAGWITGETLSIDGGRHLTCAR